MDDVEFQLNLDKYSKSKPDDLIISDLKWKYLIRTILRAKNLLIVGASGTAKTTSARCAAAVMGRPFEKFNMGSTSDARATLIGNTTYNKETGTVFHRASFIKAITTPNKIILLDELTRGSHDAWNILFPAIDPIQRCIRLDEDENSEVVDVAEGVCFLATANIGGEYTSTRVLDKAISRRFPIKLEMSFLKGKELEYLFGVRFKTRTSAEIKAMKILASISDDLLSQCKIEDAKISFPISPANMMEMAELVMDGFTIEEIAEAAIYTEYPDDGGADSERAFCRSIIQKYFPKNVKSPINDPLSAKTVPF